MMRHLVQLRVNQPTVARDLLSDLVKIVVPYVGNYHHTLSNFITNCTSTWLTVSFSLCSV